MDIAGRKINKQGNLVGFRMVLDILPVTGFFQNCIFLPLVVLDFCIFYLFQHECHIFHLPVTHCTCPAWPISALRPSRNARVAHVLQDGPPKWLGAWAGATCGVTTNNQRWRPMKHSFFLCITIGGL